MFLERVPAPTSRVSIHPLFASPFIISLNIKDTLLATAYVRHVTGNDEDYLRKIPRVVW